MGNDKNHETCIVKSGMRIYKDALENRLDNLGIKVE